MDPDREIDMKIENCPRCTLTHESIIFKPATRKTPELTHWAMCPNVDEPLILVMLPEFAESESAGGSYFGTAPVYHPEEYDEEDQELPPPPED